VKKDAINVLNKGGVAVLPTDTIFGIVARAMDKKAVEKVYKVKGRAPKKPCIILITKISDLEKFGVNNSTILTNFRIIKSLWISKRRAVSIIFPLEKKFYKQFRYLHRGTNSLAFRLVSKENKRHKNLHAIISKTGSLIAPSANPEGLAPAKNITEAKKYFKDKVDLYLSSKKQKTKPSKIVSLVSGEPVVVRK